MNYRPDESLKIIRICIFTLKNFFINITLTNGYTMKVNNGLFINIPHVGSDNVKSVVEWYPTIQYNPQPDPHYAKDLLKRKETDLT